MLAHGVELNTVPYLWTAMFGKSIRYAGKGLPEPAVEFVLVEVCWDRAATATSLAADPLCQPLLQVCFPSCLQNLVCSWPCAQARGMAVVTGGGPSKNSVP